MKKFTALMLALVMMLSLCTAIAEDTVTVEAVLYLNAYSPDGGETSMSAAQLGINMTMTFYSDYTVTAEAMDKVQTGTAVSSDDGSITISFEDGSEMVLTPNNEDMTFIGVVGDETFIFSMTPPVAYELPALISAEDVSAFDGIWTAIVIDMEGMVIDFALAMDQGLSMFFGEHAADDMVIANGIVNVFGTEDSDFVFTDGMLINHKTDDPDMAAFLNEAIQMCDDGCLAYSLMGMTIYYTEKIVTE